MGFKGGVVLGPVSLNITGSANTNINSTSNTGFVNIGNVFTPITTIQGSAINMIGDMSVSLFGETRINRTGSAAIKINDVSNDADISIGNSLTPTHTIAGAFIDINALSVINIDAAGDGGPGQINIGTDFVDKIIQIGGGDNTNQVTLGATFGESSTLIQFGNDPSGSGGFFRIEASNGLGSVVESITPMGLINNPLNSAFSAYLTSDINVTSTDTLEPIIGFTEYFDQASDFNTTTGVFTAPIAGKYHFSCTTAIHNNSGFITAPTFNLVTSTGNFIWGRGSGAPTIGSGSFTVNSYIDLDESDTASLFYSNGPGGSLPNVNITSGQYTWFSGTLIA